MIREFLKDNILLFDGAMGTLLASRDKRFRENPELSVIENPELVKAIHREYISAGAKAIKSNTFGANRVNYPENAEEIVREGWRIARETALETGSFAFADIGPVSIPDSPDKVHEEYIWLADRFLEEGAENFLFETNSSTEGLEGVASYIKERKPEAFVIMSFAVLPDGFSRDGLYAPDLQKKAAASFGADAFGMNCAQSAQHMLESVKKLPRLEGKYLSVMPNAGYPTVIGHRAIFNGSPRLFAENLSKMASSGARILGGCCGTTPEHIREIRTLLEAGIESSVPSASRKSAGDQVYNRLWDKLNRGEKVIAVELDPPETATLGKFMSGAQALKNAGVDAVTIADCPIARVRMDSSLLACKIKRELGVDAIPHMTCRDRNINATKALLLGLYAEEIRNVLLVTGDPIPTAERNEVKSVYQFNSRKMASFVSRLGEEVLGGGFHIFGALNINAVNFDVQLKIAKDKVASGMVGFLTQPVLSPRGFDNLRRAKEELDAFILGGLIPVVSEKNARYMDSEVNGISVDEKIIQAYVGKDRAEGEDLAVEITSRIAREMAPFVDGYYIITPFQRVGLVSRIIETLE